MADELDEELEERIRKQEQELKELRQEVNQLKAGDQFAESQENSRRGDVSRRDFLKVLGGAAAGIGTAAMIPSAAGNIKITDQGITKNGQSFWYQGNFSPNNYLQKSGGTLTGDLDLNNHNITNTLAITTGSADIGSLVAPLDAAGQEINDAVLSPHSVPMGINIADYGRGAILTLSDRVSAASTWENAIQIDNNEAVLVAGVIGSADLTKTHFLGSAHEDSNDGYGLTLAYGSTSYVRMSGGWFQVQSGDTNYGGNVRMMAWRLR